MIEQYINTIQNMDCLKMMKQLPDNCIDCIVTDPPYNAGREYANDNLTEIEYYNFSNKWLSECKRITKDNLIVIIGVKYQKPITMWLFNNMNYCWEFIWWKSNGMLNGKATFSKFEKVLWFSKNQGTYFRQKPEYTDVWNIPITIKTNNNGHPTPKCIKGIIKIIKLLSKSNDIIFDPFLGSGTTAIACLETERRYIGCELDKGYFDIAQKRIDDYNKQLKLF